MYVILEGIDGCGKSTQIELLKSEFKDAIFTKEPGGTKFGIQAREILLYGDLSSKKAEMLLFLADRAEHFERVIKPNLSKIVISDRGFLSGVAYAMMAGFDLDFLIKLNLFTLDNNLPQKVIIFRIDKAEVVNRVGQKSQDKIEQRGYDYLMQIQDNIFKVAKYLDLNYLEIDATLSIEEINYKILNYLKG